MAGEIRLSFPVFVTTSNPKCGPGEKQRFILFRVREGTHPDLKAGDECMALFTSQVKAEMFVRENPSVVGPEHGGVMFDAPARLHQLIAAMKAKDQSFRWIGLDVVYWDNPFEVGLHRVEAILEALESELR